MGVPARWYIVCVGRLPVRLDRRLRECNYGRMNGRPRNEVHVRRERWLEVPYPGGESWTEAIDRTVAFLDELSLRPERRILMIGHIASGLPSRCRAMESNPSGEPTAESQSVR